VVVPEFPWRTRDLPRIPDDVSPSGASEIRELPAFPAGQFAHAHAPPGETAVAATLSKITEVYYVLQGRGELWRSRGEAEEVVELRPGRCATIPPGVAFQYRTTGDALDFIVAAAPRWQREFWSEADRALWPGGTSPGPASDPPWETVDLREAADDRAPDGSEIHLLVTVPGGSVCVCRLPASATTQPVRHRTVVEVWYVISGSGALWRGSDGMEEEVELISGRGVTIPLGTAFQFRAGEDGPLEFLIGTFPPWPGPQEAEKVWLGDGW
jgi:mannose-6-phosphate isomerase-like protein (cupin superfamily)